MPGVSTPTIDYTRRQSIGIGIIAVYEPSSPDTYEPLSQDNLKWVSDSKRYYTGFRYKYTTLYQEDMSQERANEISSQYPKVQHQIQKIIEDRRIYHEKMLRKQNSKCVIL